MESMETKARDIMAMDVLSLSEDSTIEDALKMLVNKNITGLPVTDANGRMVGVLSEYDIIEQISRAKKLSAKTLQQKIHFSKKVETVEDTMPLPQIIDHFVKTKVRRLPVLTKSKRLVGIITRRDIMRVLFYRAKVS